MSSHRTTYEAFAQAWARHDIQGCLDLMTSDVEYAASVGPEPGQTYRGSEAVRRGIAAMLAHDNARTFEIASYTESDDIAFAEWRYELGDGRIELGIDRLDFRDGKIARKIAYRKTRGG